MKKQSPPALRSVVVATAMALATLSAPAVEAAGFTGNLGVVSKYVLRGITNNAEHDGAAVQAGLKYDFGGLYAAWWGSSLDYTALGNNGNAVVANSGFENDFMVGYAMDLKGMTLDVGVTKYYYMEFYNANAIEPYANLGIGPFTVGVKFLAEDVIWGNSGDTYVTGAYTQKLPADFTVTALAGFYKYDKSGKYETGLNTRKSSGFRHVDVTLAHPLGKTGFDMNITYTLGGKDRSNVDQQNMMVLGLSTAF